MPFDIVQPGEWVQPVKRGYKFECCDCGLVHVMDFRVHKDRVQLRAWRDNRTTGQHRRRRRIKVVRIDEA